MKYTIIGKSLYEYLGIEPDEALEARNEAITDTLLAEMHRRKTAIVVNVWGCKDALISEGSPDWIYYQLSDMIDALAIKDGVDLVRYEDGNLGLVAYYNGRKSYLEILTDEAEVARIENALIERDELDIEVDDWDNWLD